MNVSTKFFEKRFSDFDSKDAYLKLCKWLAQNVISKEVEIGKEVTFGVFKVEGADFPTFKLELYCSLNETDLRNGFCERCKEFHKSFYINQEYNCNACKVMAYMDQVKLKLSSKRSYRKERLEYLLRD